MFFGSFTKASTIGEGKHIIYCPGPKAIIKLNENSENLSEIG
jgi:hypothetical protein